MNEKILNLLSGYHGGTKFWEQNEVCMLYKSIVKGAKSLGAYENTF